MSSTMVRLLDPLFVMTELDLYLLLETYGTTVSQVVPVVVSLPLPPIA